MTRIVTLPRLADRPDDGHKGTFGRVLIVGGSPSMIGAPVLAGTAALRMGAGLVQLLVPRAIQAAALSITPELIGTSDARIALAAADAIVIGPGMGTTPAVRSQFMRLIKLDLPMVIDADALNLLAAEKRWPKSFKARAVLTPHPGEMKRLRRTNVPNDDDGRIEIARRAAAEYGHVVVLKGHRTVVTDGQKVYVNRTGDSSLAKAGSGDVLSGVIGTLLAENMDRFDAACAGVWIHGRAGEVAGKALGRRCVLARDVIDSLPQAITAYEQTATTT